MRRRAVPAEDLAFYRTHAREAVREDGVVCLECGALEGRLGAHVAAHGLTLGAYRAKWGYAPTARTALTSDLPEFGWNVSPAGRFAGPSSLGLRPPVHQPAPLSVA